MCSHPPKKKLGSCSCSLELPQAGAGLPQWGQGTGICSSGRGEPQHWESLVRTFPKAECGKQGEPCNGERRGDFFFPCFSLSHVLWLMMGQFIISIFQTAPKASLLPSDPMSSWRPATQHCKWGREGWFSLQGIPRGDSHPRPCCDLLRFLPR